MPSNPTTLAELVEALEAEAASARRRATTYRMYGKQGDDIGSNSASDYEALKADLVERAAKVLRVPSEVHAALLQDAADETHSDGFREVARRIAAMFEAAIDRALGGSDAERATRSEVGGTARSGADEDGPEIRDDLPPAGKASRL